MIWANSINTTIPFEDEINTPIPITSNDYFEQEDIKRVGKKYRFTDSTATESVLAAGEMEPDIKPYECSRASGVLSFWDDQSEDIYTFEDGQPV